MSFLDDLLSFGSGALEAVGEQADWLFGADTSSNPNSTQQSNQGMIDNNGNPITSGQGMVSSSTDNTLLYVGGGLGVLMLILILVFALKK